NEVWASQPREGLRVDTQAVKKVDARGEQWLQHLDHHALAEPHMLRVEHDAHAPSPSIPRVRYRGPWRTSPCPMSSVFMPEGVPARGGIDCRCPYSKRSSAALRKIASASTRGDVGYARTSLGSARRIPTGTSRKKS